MAFIEHALLYVLASSHVVVRRKYNILSRSKNVLVWALWLWMMKVCAAEDSCQKVQAPPSVTAGEDGSWYFHALVFTQLLLFVLIFMCGYFSGRSWNGSKLPTPPPATAEAASQKDEAIVPQRLRAQLAEERQRSAEFAAAAREARKAIDLNVQERESLYGERHHLFSLLRTAEDILKSAWSKRSTTTWTPVPRTSH